MVERKITDMHAWVEERLSAYIDNQLAPGERAQVDSHLAECARCRASLESLRWTVSLLKQAPAPAMPRLFTLPIEHKESRVGGFGFAFLRGATAFATLILCLVVGLDLYSQSRFGFATAPPAPGSAAQFAAPTQNIALAPTAAPPVLPTAAPTLAPAAAPPSAPTPPPAATLALRLSQPSVLPTATLSLSVGAAEAQATRGQADNAQKSGATLTAPDLQFRSGITTTAASPSPAPTQPAPTVTSTVVLEMRAQPTRAIAPSEAGTAREEFPLVRVVEIGLLGLVVTLGAVTIVLWRRT